MKRHAAVGLSIFLILGLAVTALASAGTSSNPLISLSYISSKLIPEVRELSVGKAETAFASLHDDSLRRLEASVSNALYKTGISVSDSFTVAVNNKIAASGTSHLLTPHTLKHNDTVTGFLGTSFFLRSGSAVISGGTLVNITQGSEVGAGMALNLNNRYMAVSDGEAGIRITSGNAVVDISGEYRLPPPYIPSYTELADALKQMSLFLGSDSGYSLDRSANRLEALVMLMRLIGEEQAALSYTGAHPFNDVPEWGRPYVAYAYSKGYTNGVSAERFGTESPVLSSQYMTYILRALGYSDSAGDFTWDKSIEKCLELGMITNGESNMLKNDPFYRDQVVYISYFSLGSNLKDSNQTLLDKLISSGVLTYTAADGAMSSVRIPRIM